MAKNFNRKRNVRNDYNAAVFQLESKYYNLYRGQFKWTGLNYRQEKFIMDKFWEDGTIAAFKIKNLDELGFAPWTRTSWDMYGMTETVNLINLFSAKGIPTGNLTVDKDVVLGYLQSNQKGLHSTVRWYIERIAQVETVIAINLEMQKMPYLIPVSKDNQKHCEDIIDRILNGELVIFTEDDDASQYKCVETQAPYIIDKLCNYKKELEGELKTVLTINNSAVAKIEQVQLAEANSNNDEIMDTQTDYLNELQAFCKRIKETFNIDISVESTSEDIEVQGQVHERINQPGPKEGEDNND